MKKIIAMLLCVAMVAALGVAAFADPHYSNAETRDHYADRIAFFDDAIAEATYKQSTLNEIQAFWDHYFTQTGMILSKYAGNEEDPGYIAEKKAYDFEAKLELAELKAKYAGVWYTDPEAIAALYDFAATSETSRDDVFDVCNTEFDALQEIIDTAIAMNEEEDNDFWLAIYTKLAADDAAAEAAAKAAAELAAKIAAATAGIDRSTPAGELLYEGTAQKVYAQEALAAAKKAADSAKKAIATAQKGAYTAAQAAVLSAQGHAYEQLADGINVAVADYVDSVYTSILDFYASLN